MRKVFCAACIFFVFQLQAQQLPYWNEIQEFKRQDSIRFPPKKAIVFTGSSSFRMWKNVQEDFPRHKIINRGFGGSTLADVIQYAHQIILSYKPRQVVIYCGENDFIKSDTVTGEDVAGRFIQLFNIIRKKYPKTAIAFVSIKPSPSRERFREKIREANTLIRNYISKQKRASYINVYDSMLDASGNPKKELFQKDMLHMKPEGYALWKREIERYLVR